MLDSIGSAHTGILVTYGMNISLHGVTITGVDDNGVALSHVYNGKVPNSMITGSTSPAPAIGNAGYGVAVVKASCCAQAYRSYFDNCRVYVDGGGFFPASIVDVVGSQKQRSSNYAFASMEPCSYWRVASNMVIGAVG